MLERNAQKRLSRHPRGHRVPIFLDVEDFGATPKEQLPFVVAVLAQLGGDAKRPADKWSKEAPQEINRNNFETVVGKVRPELQFSVDSKLKNAKPGDKLPLNLIFTKASDFEPEGVAMQVGSLKTLLLRRARLRELLSLLKTDADLRAQLVTLLKSTSSREQIKSALGGLLDAREPKTLPGPTV